MNNPTTPLARSQPLPIMLQRYRARWLFPIDRPPIAGGVLTVRDGIIAEIAAQSDGPATDLGDVAILPALINAHTHLEFSDLAEPLGTAREPLPTWISRVVARRRSQPTEEQRQRLSREHAHTFGLAESAAAGIAAVGEIATPGWPEPVYHEASIGGVVFLELLGLAEERIEPLLQSAREHLQRPEPRATERQTLPTWPRWPSGLSPHAPYTVHPRLLAEACQLAAARQAPVAMHLAESREELELLATGRGAMREMIESLGAWRDGVIPTGIRIIDYLRPLATSPRSLVIHGNYLTDEELQFIAAQQGRMTVVYCPRTHAYFGHEPYPLAKLLAASVPTALGTDSRASNPDLDLWNEVLEVIRRHPQVAPSEVLRMAMLNAAAALGLASELGSLTPGKRFVTTTKQCSASDDPYDALLG